MLRIAPYVQRQARGLNSCATCGVAFYVGEFVPASLHVPDDLAPRSSSP